MGGLRKYGTADSTQFGNYAQRRALHDAVMGPYRTVTEKIGFASGAISGTHTWVDQEGKPTYNASEDGKIGRAHV